jgi:signal transduction histidine kinase
MLSKKAIIFYWALLIIPTILIGYWGAKMIRHEQERIADLQKEAIRGRLKSLAQEISMGLMVRKNAIINNLEDIYVSQNTVLVDRLIQWKQQDPMVRCAFLHDLKQGLIFPSEDFGATLDEYGFMARYDALLTGRAPWLGTANGTNHSRESMENGSQAALGSSRRANVGANGNYIRNKRAGLFQRQRSFSRQVAPESPYADPIDDQGWLPWFADNRLNILVWVKGDSDRLVWGVELEMMTLLSRLTELFNIQPPSGLVYALVDAGGNILHQKGGRPIEPGMVPDISVPLGAKLPRWELTAYYAQEAAQAGAAGSFYIVSSLTLAAVLIALLSGGALLTWQAGRNMREARLKSNFVSNISHELKTPLTSIRMYAELMADGRVTDRIKQRHYLGIISMEVQRLTRLVNNALRLGRMEKGGDRHNCENLELGALIREALEGHKPRIIDAGIKVRFDEMKSAIVVFGDRDALEQVFLNLLDNAIKYASQGGELTILTDTSGGYGLARFVDKGPGVPKGSEEKIFEKFTRLDDSLTTKQPGSGLGLTISRSALRDMRGDLLYERATGGGCCFIVMLPLVNKKACEPGNGDEHEKEQNSRG